VPQGSGPGGASLKIAGMGLFSLLTTLAGVVFVVIGLVLGALGLTTGAMVGLLIGIASIVVASLIKDSR